MRTPWKERTRDCVTSAKFFFHAFVLFAVFVQTQQQQKDVKSKWDNRLLPTNSVYEQTRDAVPSTGNVPSIRSQNVNKASDDTKNVDGSSSIENVEESETIYDDDYEDAEPEEEAPNSSSSVSGSLRESASREDHAKNVKLNKNEEPEDSSIVQDDDYFYYDDYENPKNPENEAGDNVKDSGDYVESFEEIETPGSNEKRSNVSEITSETTSKPIVTTSRSSIEEPSFEDDVTSFEHKNQKEKLPYEDSNYQDGEILIGVVSVVTTKSVVNGTISVPVSPSPLTTEQMSAPTIPTSTPNPGINLSPRISNDSSDFTEAMETTEDSRIVASVQTSRSISGARFLPFLVVEGIDKNSDDDENNPTTEKNSSFDAESNESLTKKSEYNEKMINEDNEKIVATTIGKTSLPVESTESIIDKLDRVQSELSSGFLAGGFRTSGNTLQLDVLGAQRPEQTRKSYTTTSRIPVISKFVPRRYNQERKVAATTPSVATKIIEIVTTEEETSKNSSEKLKFRWPSATRNSRLSTTESHGGTKINVRPFVSNNPGKSKTTASTVSNPIVRDISAFLPPGYKLKKEDEEVTEKSVLSEILAKSKVDITALLPANYSSKVEIEKTKDVSLEETKLVEEEAEEKISIEKNLESLFSKSKVNFSSFLPADFNANGKKIDEETSTVSGTVEKPMKTEKSLQDLFSKASVDISALLPPGYNGFKKDETVGTEKSTVTTSEVTTVAATAGTTVRPAGGIKLVFPSRPGGRKAVHKAVTTTHSSRAEGGGSGAVSPKIQKGWPVRATTEFTGWPTPSTTPISIEKLLEAARTATVASTNVSAVPTMSTSSTTSTSTTTTTTQRPTTPGICEDECEVAGTIRIVGNATWVPELLDRNTQEWQLLAEEIEKEMNLVFEKSSVLRKWYKRVRIDAFSPGSILVDYFIELTDLKQRINTQELKVIFHDSLTTYNTDKWNETKTKGPIRLGAFALDPKSTDFVVIPKVSFPQHIEIDDRLIPQWAIAVIVIGVGGLVFIIIFGVSVLVNRQNAAKSKPSQAVYTGEVAKNMIQASHGATSHRSSQDYPKSEISTIWNDTTVWRDKSFESNSNEVLVDGTLGRERHIDRQHHDNRKYNMYDSWRSEWNGYYYNPSHGSSKFAGYESTTNLSRHPPDYDTNF